MSPSLVRSRPPMQLILSGDSSARRKNLSTLHFHKIENPFRLLAVVGLTDVKLHSSLLRPKTDSRSLDSLSRFFKELVCALCSDALDFLRLLA